MVAFNVGFFRTTSFASGISCEMVGYYLHYKMSVMYSTWIFLAFQQGMWLFAVAKLRLRDRKRGGPTLAKRSTSKSSVANRARLRKQHAELNKGGVGGIVIETIALLTETMASALFLNFFFGAACLMFWDSTAKEWSQYLPYFISDVFGTCAASGYAQDFHLPCLS